MSLMIEYIEKEGGGSKKGTINDDRYSHELQAWGFCVHVKEGVNQ